MAGDGECVSLDRGLVRLAAIGFGMWAIILPLTAYWVWGEVKGIENRIAPGILPIATERITNLERAHFALAQSFYDHDNWGDTEHKEIRASIAEMRLEIERLKGRMP